MSGRSVIPGFAWFERSIRDWSFRRKIWLLPIVAGLALSTIVLATTAIAVVDYFRLQEIQQQSFPSLQHTDRLRTLFRAIPAALRSAVATHEIDKLAAADSLRDEFRTEVATITAITPNEAAQFTVLDREFREYYDVARSTSLLLLDRQSDDSTRAAITVMMRKHSLVSILVDDAYRQDELAITDSFRLAGLLQRIAWGVGGLVTLLCITVLSLITVALTRALTSSLRDAIRIADQVAAGDMTVKIPDPSDDEVGQLLRAMQRMVAYLGGMSRIADGIAQGDTSVPIAHLSEHDQFGAAFAAMVAYLDQMAVVAERLGDGDLTLAITPRSERDRFGQAFANTFDRLTANIGGLRESEARLLLALEVADVRIWEWDMDTDRITGMALDRADKGQSGPLTASNFLGRLHPDDRMRVAGVFNKASETREDFEVVFRTNQPDEPPHWLSTRGRVVGGDGAVGARILVAAQDVTARQHADESLRRQALVFETISDSVLVVGADDVILDANPAATTIFGYSRDEMVGRARPVWGHLDPERRLAVESALRAHGTWEGELPLLRKDGGTGIIHLVIKSFFDQRGAHVANIAIARDLTDQRHLEQQLMQTSKLEAIGSLAAGIAHEINTPVQYVGDNVSFLAAGLHAFSTLCLQARSLIAAARSSDGLAPLVAAFEANEESLDIEYIGEQWPKAAEHAQDGVERIAEIVRAMKEFSHPGTLAKVDIDLNAAINNTVTVCRNEWRYVATLTLDLDKNLPRLVCMPGELQQVILNLVINAAQAIGDRPGGDNPEGAIAISTREAAGWVEIRVSDNGPGIPTAIRTKIFDPFFTTKDVGKGTGQGLALAYNTITMKHHGSITVDSTEGLGTTFTVRLPLNYDPVTATAA